MAEEIWEQQYYGSYCKHGTNVGTPGGADLMCGACEMGWDTWYDDPRWSVYVSFNQEMDGVPWRGSKILSLRESEFGRQNIADLLPFKEEDYARVQEAGVTLHWEVFREDGGYWDE